MVLLLHGWRQTFSAIIYRLLSVIMAYHFSDLIMIRREKYIFIFPCFDYLWGMRCSCSGIVVLLIVLFLVFTWWNFYKKGQYQQILEYHISSDGAITLKSGKNCTTDTCLNLLPCSLHNNQLTVFIEPFIRVIDEVNYFFDDCLDRIEI